MSEIKIFGPYHVTKHDIVYAPVSAFQMPQRIATITNIQGLVICHIYDTGFQEVNKKLIECLLLALNAE
jgi:hypothetical protein